VWEIGCSGLDLQALWNKGWSLETDWWRFQATQSDESPGPFRVLKSELDWRSEVERSSEDRFSTAHLERLLAGIGSAWPDIIVSTNFLATLASRAQPWLPGLAINFLYHFLEAGGMLLGVEPRDIASSGDALQEFAGANGGESVFHSDSCVAVKIVKEANIYIPPTIKVANRKSIFDEATCRASVQEAMSRLPLQTGAEVLDVGVGDGRFSKYILANCKESGWLYTGLEMTSKKEMHPSTAELDGYVHDGCNFFTYAPGRKFDAVFLFFVLHTFKHWPLYLYRALGLLAPGGYLLLSGRTDSFIKWTHGAFDRAAPDGGRSLIEDVCRSYWAARDCLGARNYDQVDTITSPERQVRLAETMGFVEVASVMKETQRVYHLERAHICPSGDYPAYWNVGRIGVTKQDEPYLQAAFKPESVEELLDENMLIFILRKQ
jgi:SAM-dependent methyltransferase